MKCMSVNSDTRPEPVRQMERRELLKTLGENIWNPDGKEN